MRIGLLHPTYWPEVRRGSERLVHDLAATLARRGHQVTVVTSHDEATTIATEEGFRVIRSHRPPEPRITRWYEFHVGNGLNVFRRIAGGGFDVVHAFFTVDAMAALAARRIGGPPVVFSFHGIPVRKYLVGRRYRLEWLSTIVREADALTVLSEAARDRFQRYLGGEPRVLPGGVILENFARTDAKRAAEPTLLCAASLTDPYKRGELILKGFERARQAHPDLRLVLVEGRDPFLGTVDLDLPEGVSTLSGDDNAVLAKAYGSAWATVIASIEEAFGLVVLESLAAGTPVVASRSGGLPELVSDGVGRLFEPDDMDGLLVAIDEALEMSDDSSAIAECRARAAEYDWDSVVESYEALYEDVLGRGRR